MTIEEITEEIEQAEDLNTEEAAEEETETQESEEGAGGGNAPKYIIGDKTFATQAEALAYAQQNLAALEREREILDAYRQGMTDASQQSGQGASGATEEPAEDPLLADFDEDEFYTNPKEALKKVAARVREQALTEQQRLIAQRDQDAQVWAEFTADHPEMADYRAEVTSFVQSHAQEVSAIANTKGRKAAYAFVAGKLKEQFSRYAKALGPRKVLSRGGAPSPAGQGTGAKGVTPKGGAKKPLSMAEQIRSIRKGRAL